MNKNGNLQNGIGI
jgi:hypothetical protein